MSTARMPAAGLGIGAAILAAWIAAEGFSADPIIPVRGDVPTIGHGATRYEDGTDRKSTRLNSSHLVISYAVFCLKKKTKSNEGPHEPEPSYAASDGWRLLRA